MHCKVFQGIHCPSLMFFVFFYFFIFLFFFIIIIIFFFFLNYESALWFICILDGFVSGKWSQECILKFKLFHSVGIFTCIPSDNQGLKYRDISMSYRYFGNLSGISPIFRNLSAFYWWYFGVVDTVNTGYGGQT